MYCQLVNDFTSACNDDLPQQPKYMSIESIHFLTDMLQAEFKELMESKTVEDQQDALVDMIYYICDAAIKQGVNLDPLFLEVHGANMLKVGPDGKVLKNEQGKVLKPEGWTPPDLKAEVDRQRSVGPFGP